MVVGGGGGGVGGCVGAWGWGWGVVRWGSLACNPACHPLASVMFDLPLDLSFTSAGSRSHVLAQYTVDAAEQQRISQDGRVRFCSCAVFLPACMVHTLGPAATRQPSLDQMLPKLLHWPPAVLLPQHQSMLCVRCSLPALLPRCCRHPSCLATAPRFCWVPVVDAAGSCCKA